MLMGQQKASTYIKHSGRFRKANISLGSFVQLACHVKYYMAIKELITRARYTVICQ